MSRPIAIYCSRSPWQFRF